jgi:hypothetical protein
MKLRFDESSRTILTGLSVLLRNAMFIFTPMNPVGSILGRRLRFQVSPRSPLRPILCYCTPFLEVGRKPFAFQSLLYAMRGVSLDLHYAVNAN